MIMSEEIKKIVENAKSEDEFLKNLDKVGHRLSDEELEAVSGGSVAPPTYCYPAYILDN